MSDQNNPVICADQQGLLEPEETNAQPVEQQFPEDVLADPALVDENAEVPVHRIERLQDEVLKKLDALDNQILTLLESVRSSTDIAGDE